MRTPQEIAKAFALNDRPGVIRLSTNFKRRRGRPSSIDWLDAFDALLKSLPPDISERRRTRGLVENALGPSKEQTARDRATLARDRQTALKKCRGEGPASANQQRAGERSARLQDVERVLLRAGIRLSRLSANSAAERLRRDFPDISVRTLRRYVAAIRKLARPT